jgi:DNA-binding IclR family transcriptional regulator
MITRADNHRYVVGLRVATLTEAFRRQFMPTEFLTRHIREIARLTGESAYAVGWWNGEIAILGQVQGSNAVRAADNQLGPYAAANARASGKLMLAYATEAQRKDYLDRHPPQRCTQYTITDAKRLEKEFAAIVKRGYATDEQEFAEGLSCLAVPVDEGLSPFGLVVSAPTARFKQKRNEYLKVVKSVAAGLSGGKVDES